MSIPGGHVFSYYLRRARYRYRQRHGEKGMVGQWHLLWGRADMSALLAPQPGTLKKLIAPPDRYWADPFLWKRGNEFYVFCEEVLYREKRGYIAAISLDESGQIQGPSRKVLAEPFHLSYPFLFAFDGELYLIPESGFANVLNLYRCVEFPYRWEKVHSIFEGVQVFDTTLFENGGRWWLFTTVRNPRRLQLPDHDLQLYSADSPLAQNWIAHPCNSIVRDLRRARPGGRMFQHGGKLYRPSQNCLHRYGGSLNINEVTRLDDSGYEERLVNEVKPDWEPGYIGLHHLDWHEGVIIMDAQRLIPETEIQM